MNEESKAYDTRESLKVSLKVLSNWRCNFSPMTSQRERPNKQFFLLLSSNPLTAWSIGGRVDKVPIANHNKLFYLAWLAFQRGIACQKQTLSKQLQPYPGANGLTHVNMIYQAGGLSHLVPARERSQRALNLRKVQTLQPKKKEAGNSYGLILTLCHSCLAIDIEPCRPARR